MSTQRRLLQAIGVLYTLLVFNFYQKTDGFSATHNVTYSLWKITPVTFLAIFSFLHGAGLNQSDRFLSGLGLAFGALGDYIIGLSSEGIIPGAISFGVGHFMYMSLMIRHEFKIHNQLVVGMLVQGLLVGQLCLLPLLQEHTVAVGIFSVYSLILSSITIVAISQYLNGAKNEGIQWRALGFLLFYTSDTILIMAHTGHWKVASELCVLVTYFLAQYLILYGNALALAPEDKTPTTSTRSRKRSVTFS